MMDKIVLFLCGLLVLTQGRVIENFESRIVNGDEAKLGEIPYQVSLQSNGFHSCGGSILNKNYVVTAAHCVDGQADNSITVVAGTINYKTAHQKRQSVKLIKHEKYAPLDSTRNDVALIKVAVPFEFDELVRPVSLPKLHEKVATNSSAVVSGWGYHGYGSAEVPLKLFKAKIQIADPAYCQKVMKDVGRNIYPTNVCAYDPSVRRGQCNGDSGGPLVVDGKLTGIVSWSVKDPYCASTKYPGVYTRVSEFVDWINKNAL